MTIGKVGKMLIPRLFFIVYFIYTLYSTVCYYMDCLLQLLSPNAVSPLLAPENSRPLLRWPAYIATAHSCLLPMPSHPTLPFSVRLSITCLLSYKLPARRRFVDSTISKCDLCTIFPSLYTSNIYFCAE